MVADAALNDIMREAPDITTAADRLVAAALQAGGRDNVTVVLFRIEDVVGADDPPTEALALASEPQAIVERPVGAAAQAAGEESETEGAPEPAIATTADASPARRLVARSPRGHRRSPRMPRAPSRRPRRRRRLAIGGALVVVLGVIAIAALLAGQAVYFVGTDSNGQVTVFNGLPYTLPGGLRLYTQYFVSGVTVAELSPLERHRLFNNELRSQQAATHLVSQLELDQIVGQ
jgi:protein phosphatase